MTTTTDAVFIEFTPGELRLLTNALHAFVSDFGHDEADVLHQAKALLDKLVTAAR